MPTSLRCQLTTTCSRPHGHEGACMTAAPAGLGLNKETRNFIASATQSARSLLEKDFAAQLEGDFDVHRNGTVGAKAGRHLSARQAFQRERIVAAIEHKRSTGLSPEDAVRDYLRDAAFTTLNRFVALKMLEARELVQECISKGEQSGGYREFCGMAPGLPLLPESAGYGLYLESLFDELSTEVKVLFDRRDPSSVLWPKRATFEQLLEILNATELARVWGEDETIGWVYQFFNGQDERRKMREESQAPRNSRELAVRNQFFTPRYVVQFLTDNTLGRIWYEMRGTKTALADKCEYMVRKPGEEFAPRAKKDPRDLRVLDPACGSGHFLLYAFDLLLAMYEEAYLDPASPKSEATGNALAEDYPSLDALKKAVPGLVLAHNLHGVDIDPRCAQIAQLALWMRAQKAYRDFGIGRSERAKIRRSNIVVAEPLVADEQIAKEFVAKLGDAELGRVFMNLAESLNLAGDLGLLLRVEQLVASEVRRGHTRDLFAPPEQRIRRSLDGFADNSARGAMAPARRLFVDDAANGIGLLTLAELRFDATVMNPPFGQFTSRSLELAKSSYEGASNDIFACFVARAIELSRSDGLIGVLSSRLGFFLEGLEPWRHQLLREDAGLSIVLDLGYGVLDDALVETAAYVVTPHTQEPTLTAIRVLRDRDKGARTLHLLRSLAGVEESPRDIFVRRRAELAATPGRVVAYWLPPELLRLLSEHRDLGSDGVIAYSGLQTDDDYRFLRLWWEVDGQSNRWLPFAKGGEYQPYADDLHLVVNWATEGREMKAFVESKYRQWSRHIKNTDKYFLSGLTYTERTTSDISVRAFPRNAIFSVSGPVVQCSDPGTLLLAWAVLSSRAGRALMDTLVGSGDTSKSGTAARHYRTRLVAALPSVSATISLEQRAHLKNNLRVLWNANQSVQVRDETHRQYSGFVVPQTTQGFESAALAELREDARDFADASSASATIDGVVARAFGLTDETALSDFAGPHPSVPFVRETALPIDEVLARVLELSDEDLTALALASGLDGRVATKRSYFYSRRFELACLIAGHRSEAVLAAADSVEPRCVLRRQSELATQALSVALGVAFGRWSAPWTTRDMVRERVSKTDPFDALPPPSLPT